MIKKSFLTATILLTLGGCMSQSALSVFGEDAVYEKGLEYTQVSDIVQSFETKAILNATYLNSSEPKKWDNGKENFLVGIYITDDNKKEKDRYINNTKYSLTLNDKSYEKIEELEPSSYLYSHIPLKNPHAKYYIATFVKDGNETLVLKYENTTDGKAVLTFQAQ